MNLINCIIVLILTTFTIATAPPIDVVFIIQSQDTKYQSELSRNLKENIIKQSVELQPKYRINVHILHEIFNYPGGWTIHNLIPQLMLLQRKSHINTNLQESESTNANTNTNTDTDTTNTNKQIDMKVINDNTRWIVFCQEGTRVNVQLLMEKLNNENYTQPLYLGHPLYDREPTIIHHFAFFENPKWFPYPMLRAGVVFSMPLFKSIADIYANHNNNKHLKQQSKLLQRSEFSIDASHELARFIYDNVQIETTTATATLQKNDKNNKIKNKNSHVNVYHDTTSHTISQERKTPTTNEPPRTTTSTYSDTNNTDDITATTTNISDLSYSDFRTTTTNEIIDKHKDNISKPNDSSNSTSTTNNNNSNQSYKRQKIILKKASYICPTATWETGSMNNKKNNYIKHSNTNKNNKENEACAMYAAAEQTTNAASSMTCIPVKREEIYFAVKTCTKYHNERLPIIQTTWAPYAKHIKYFSDLQDDTKQTTNTGIPNVEMGHCAKTLQILKLALRDIENYNNNYKNNIDNINSNNKHERFHHVNQIKHENHQIQWLFLTDDDTLLSVSGVCQVLGCYNSMDEIYLGERYGYRLYAQDGFNYITGGGGIAFSLPVVKLILQHCSCPSPSAPDDMILGSCLHSLQLKALHSSRFHQARPHDYPLELLKQEPPVSFHKFWQHDPVEVYNHWFAAADRELLAEEQLMQENLIELNYHSKKTRKLLARTEPLNLNEIPVSLVASLHHSKERHVDL